MKKILLPAFLVLLLSGSASLAATYFDVTVGLRVNEDSRIFLNVANETWRPSGPTTIIRQCADPEDDFPVIAFLAYHSHRSPASILRLRRAGYDWSEIFYRLDVSPRVLFVGIDRDPGPPYGKAWDIGEGTATRPTATRTMGERATGERDSVSRTATWSIW
jgi:hypothetical protein